MTANKFAAQMMQAAIRAQTVDEWWRLWEMRLTNESSWHQCRHVVEMWQSDVEYRLKQPTESKEDRPMEIEEALSMSRTMSKMRIPCRYEDMEKAINCLADNYETSRNVLRGYMGRLEELAAALNGIKGMADIEATGGSKTWARASKTISDLLGLKS